MIFEMAILFRSTLYIYLNIEEFSDMDSLICELFVETDQCF